jgi:hypothetical protein
MYDSSPDSITARLVRRDVEATSDLFGIFLDPYYDKRSGYYFGVNAAGTLYDGVLYNDDWDDNSWDGVWEGKVDVNNEGWTAEFRIPFSQLRFHKNHKNTWGINLRRDVARKNEQTFLVHKPKNESGFVSRFGDLTGIDEISPPGILKFFLMQQQEQNIQVRSRTILLKTGQVISPALVQILKWESELISILMQQ